MLAVQPQDCVLVEDNVTNLRPAKALGMTTVLVGSDSDDPSVDHHLVRIEDIGTLF
jgi:putative hydrolase of the HAD superfamily